jgi:hypothetical protein
MQPSNIYDRAAWIRVQKTRENLRQWLIEAEIARAKDSPPSQESSKKEDTSSS